MSLRNSAQVRKHLLYIFLKVVLLKFVTSRNLILTSVFKFKFSIVNRVSDRVSRPSHVEHSYGTSQGSCHIQQRRQSAPAPAAF